MRSSYIKDPIKVAEHLAITDRSSMGLLYNRYTDTFGITDAEILVTLIKASVNRKKLIESRDPELRHYTGNFKNFSFKGGHFYVLGSEMNSYSLDPYYRIDSIINWFTEIDERWVEFLSAIKIFKHARIRKDAVPLAGIKSGAEIKEELIAAAANYNVVIKPESIKLFLSKNLNLKSLSLRNSIFRWNGYRPPKKGLPLFDGCIEAMYFDVKIPNLKEQVDDAKQYWNNIEELLKRYPNLKSRSVSLDRTLNKFRSRYRKFLKKNN